MCIKSAAEARSAADAKGFPEATIVVSPSRTKGDKYVFRWKVDPDSVLYKCLPDNAWGAVLSVENNGCAEVSFYNNGKYESRWLGYGQFSGQVYEKVA